MVVFKNIPTYLESNLLRRQHFGLKLADGWVFGKVIDFEDVQFIFDQYPTLAPLSSTAIVPPKTVTDEWNEWKLMPNNEAIFYEWDSERLLQAFIGIHPAPCRLWKRFPSPVPRGSLSKIKVTSIGINTVGWIDGHQSGSPFDMPSALTEMLIPKEVSQIEWAVFNPLPINIAPKFKLNIRRHQVKYYNPEKQAERDTIDAMWSGKIAWKPWSPGLDPWSYDTSKQIGVNPVLFK
jgi:hypothetical protein